MLEFHDIHERIRAFRCYPWVYKVTGQKVHVYRDGFAGLDREGNHRGPSAETIRLWCQEDTIPTEASLTKMLAVIHEDMLNPPALTLEKLSSTFPITEFYATLNVDPQQADELLFTLWAQHDIGLCKSFTFPDASAAERFSQVHGPGLYIGERWSQTTSRSEGQRFALAVYRKVRASTTAFNKVFFIPARLSLRSRAGHHLYRYLGAVGLMENAVEWGFFEQGRAPRDRLRIMTTKGDPRNHVPYTGAMLTMTEGPDFKPITYEVSISRCSDLPSLEDTRKFLAETPGVSTGALTKTSRGLALKASRTVKRKPPRSV